MMHAPMSPLAVGDRIRVKGTPHEPGQTTGTVALVEHGPAYGIRFDAGPTDDDDMSGEVHKWYVGDELELQGGAGKSGMGRSESQMVHAAAVEYAHTKAENYADPGYQPDGKKRYALDSERECRAAWSYINMPKNAAKYTPAQVARIKSRIKAAGKKYGIQFAAEVHAASASDLFGVELARPGAWKLRTGQTEFTDQMLKDAADFFAASGGQAVPINLGHKDDRFSGEPTFGSVTNIRYLVDDRGPVLLGDIVGMPNWLSASAPSRWPNRSVEGWQDVTYDGRDYSLILSGLSFLGAVPPAVRNIRSLADLQNALAASSAIPVFASAPDDDSAAPPSVPDELSEEDIEDPAPEAVVPSSEEKEAGMDPAKIRERLGLDDDVSDDEVMEALAYAGFVPAPEFDDPAPVPVAASARPVAKPGTMVIEASAWDALQERTKALEARDALRRRDERDDIITRAVQEGKFAPARREHWVRLWDADPEGTRQVIDTLAKNVMPVMAAGYAGDVEVEEDELDREIARLSMPTGKKG